MRRWRVLCLPLLLVLALVPCQAAPRTDTVLLLHTNDVHDNMRAVEGACGGLVYASGYLHRRQRERPDVIMADAGDMCEKGDMLGVVSKGLLTHRAMAAVGYAGGCPGNHEGAYGAQRWADNVRASGYPEIACNVLWADNGEPVFPAYREVNADGVKVALIGVGNLIRGSIDGREVKSLPPVEVGPRLARLAQELHTRNQLVIAVCHWGSKDCRRMAEAAPAVDVFVSGHTHELLAEPVQTKPGGAIIVQAGQYAEHLGEVELTVNMDTGGVQAFSGRLVRLEHATTPADEALQARLLAWNRAFCPEALQVLGRAPAALLSHYASPRPSPLARWLAEALHYRSGADLAVCGDGMLRHALAAGPVCGDDLYKTVVNGSRRIACEATVSGAQLPAVLEKLLGRPDAARLSFAGLQVRADLSRPAGRRLGALTLDPARTYRLVVPSMLCRDNSGNWALGVEMHELPYTVYDAAVSWAQRQRVVREPRRLPLPAAQPAAG